MGPKSMFYVELGLDVALNHPEIIPSGFGVSEFKKDELLAKALNEIFVVLTPLNEMLDDTRKLVGVECMKHADKIYNIVKLSAKGDDALDKIKSQLGEKYKSIGLNGVIPKEKVKRNESYVYFELKEANC